MSVDGEGATWGDSGPRVFIRPQLAPGCVMDVEDHDVSTADCENNPVLTLSLAIEQFSQLLVESAALGDHGAAQWLAGEGLDLREEPLVPAFGLRRREVLGDPLGGRISDRSRASPASDTTLSAPAMSHSGF